jgi:hypothetical protein
MARSRYKKRLKAALEKGLTEVVGTIAPFAIAARGTQAIVCRDRLGTSK